MYYSMAISLAFLLSLSVAYVGLDRDRVLYPTALVVVAVYYILFALQGAAAQTLIIECSILWVFLIATVLDFHRSLGYSATALIARGFFDLAHEQFASDPWVPAWWSSLCTTYELTAMTCLAAALWQRGRSPAAFNPIRYRIEKLASPDAMASQ